MAFTSKHSLLSIWFLIALLSSWTARVSGGRDYCEGGGEWEADPSCHSWKDESLCDLAMNCYWSSFHSHCYSRYTDCSDVRTKTACKELQGTHGCLWILGRPVVVTLFVVSLVFFVVIVMSIRCWCINISRKHRLQQKAMEQIGRKHRLQQQATKQIGRKGQEQPQGHQLEPEQRRGSPTVIADPVIPCCCDVPMAEPPIVLDGDDDDDEMGLGMSKKNWSSRPNCAPLSEHQHPPAHPNHRVGPEEEVSIESGAVATSYATCSSTAPIHSQQQQQEEQQAIPIRCYTGLVPVTLPAVVATETTRVVTKGRLEHEEERQNRRTTPAQELQEKKQHAERQEQMVPVTTIATPAVRKIPETAPAPTLVAAPTANLELASSSSSREGWVRDGSVTTVSERIETLPDGRLVMIVSHETLNPDGTKRVKIERFVKKG